MNLKTVDEIAAIQRECKRLTDGAEFMRQLADQQIELAERMRPMPDYWRVGQKVKTRRAEEWRWSKGDVLVIVAVSQPDLPASQFQHITTASIPDRGARWYTVPQDVELYEDHP